MQSSERNHATGRGAGWIFLAVLTALGVSGCGDWREIDDGLQASDSPQVEVAPSDGVVFGAASMGAEASELLLLSNTGAAPLRVRSIRLEEDDDAQEFVLADAPAGAAGEPGACPLGSPFVLDVAAAGPARSACVVAVLHRPRDAAADAARLLIESNDPVRPELTLPLRAAATQPQLVLQPASLRFGDVPLGERSCAPVAVLNAGRAPLTVESLLLLDDAGGQLEIAGVRLHAREAQLPAVLLPTAAGERPAALEVEVCFQPHHAGPVDGSLRIANDDPRDPAAVVSLSGGAVRRCVEIAPADLDFGDVVLGERTVQALELRNCGDLPVRVLAAELVSPGDGTSDDFRLHTVPEGLECNADETACNGSVSILPGAAGDILVSYAPATEGPDGGQLRVRTDTPGAEEVQVLLFGRGSNNACPRALAEARVAGALEWTESGQEDPLRILPLATLELRGDGSQDPDGEIARWQWAVIERPEDSRSQVAPHASASNPSLFIDLAGRYVIELQVFDDRGLPSCAPAVVVLDAVPCEDIHVQLVWDTPGDPDQDDQGFAAGSDLDLHLLHPLGDWFDLPHDTFYGNPNPDWGRPANPGDDPSLDRDDTDGAGPENINLDNPEDGRVYRVGVHYFNDHGYGPSFATVRLFVQGVLVFELPNRRLGATDTFWDVLTITWPGGAVHTVDTIAQRAP